MKNWCLIDNWPKSGNVKVSRSLFLQIVLVNLTVKTFKTSEMIETILVLTTFFGHVFAAEFQWVSVRTKLNSTHESLLPNRKKFNDFPPSSVFPTYVHALLLNCMELISQRLSTYFCFAASAELLQSINLYTLCCVSWQIGTHFCWTPARKCKILWQDAAAQEGWPSHSSFLPCNRNGPRFNRRDVDGELNRLNIFRHFSILFNILRPTPLTSSLHKPGKIID